MYKGGRSRGGGDFARVGVRESRKREGERTRKGGSERDWKRWEKAWRARDGKEEAERRLERERRERGGAVSRKAKGGG